MPALICAAFSYCSAIAISRLRPDTCMCPKPGCVPLQARSMICRSRFAQLRREATGQHDRTSARSGRCLPRLSGAVLPTLGPRTIGPATEGAARYRLVPHWGHISNAVIDAVTKRWHTTRAATGTVPSASLQRAIAGYSTRRPACCPCPTSMPSLPSLNN